MGYKKYTLLVKDIKNVFVGCKQEFCLAPHYWNTVLVLHSVI